MAELEQLEAGLGDAERVTLGKPGHLLRPSPTPAPGQRGERFGSCGRSALGEGAGGGRSGRGQARGRAAL
jgi:hypothetical protein